MPRTWRRTCGRGTLTQADATQIGELVSVGPNLGTDPALWPVRPVA